MKKEEFFKEVINNSKGPLEGIKVLEIGGMHTAPMCGMVLADLGVEVIKVEQPEGELVRYAGPFLEGKPPQETSTYFLSINRNKKGITINMRHPEGQEIFRDLAAKVDVLIQNFKPGTMARWRVGYDDIKRLNPKIVYISISMFGQYGPYHKRPGFDPLAQAMGGIMYVTGMPGEMPLRTGNAIVDNSTGWMAAIGALSALLYRKETGKGQHVDISLLDNTVYMSDFGLMAAAHTNYHWVRNGNRHPSVSPFNTYQTKDGYIFIIIGPDSHWAKFCRIMGREDLIADPRCKTVRDRGANAEMIDQLTAQWAKGKTVEEIMNIFLENEIPAAPIWSHKDILTNEHVQERGMVAEVDHPAAGRVKLQGIPWKHSLTPGKVRTPAPTLGQHTTEILTNWLGYDQEMISSLKERRAI